MGFVFCVYLTYSSPAVGRAGHFVYHLLLRAGDTGRPSPPCRGEGLSDWELLSLGAGSHQRLAGFVAGVLRKVLHEAAGKPQAGEEPKATITAA